MKMQKVKMVIDFKVPCERKAYGKRTKNNLPWKKYAMHDMAEWIKNIDEVKDSIIGTIKIGDISFKWGKIMDSD